MSFLSVMKRVVHIGEVAAPVVATAINPAAGAITNAVVNAVMVAEQIGGTGPDKRALVIQQVAPMVVPMVSAMVQPSKVNLSADGVNIAVGQLADGIVALLNAVKTPETKIPEKAS